MLTNRHKNVLYVGFTNDLLVRISQHEEEAAKPASKTFAGRYKCCYLVYYEIHQDPGQGISREKEIKSWRRSKKNTLVNDFNPEWRFFNDELLGR
jgi:putative endonuclease